MMSDEWKREMSISQAHTDHRPPTTDHHFMLRYTTWRSPLGPMVLWASPHGLVRLEFADRDDQRISNWLGRYFGAVVPSAAPTDDEMLGEAIAQLNDYFAGQRRAFELPLDLRGTPFQLEVWRALLAIPWGATRSYGTLAQEIGHSKAVRAVGAANGANPLSIIVPCHRLVASNGSLRAYGGGLERKQRLLELEERYL